MRLLYLYREIMPYNLPVFECLIQNGVELVIVHDNRNKITPYQADIKGVKSIWGLKETSSKKVWEISLAFQPDVIYVVDRTISIYNNIGFHFKNKYNKPVICGNDTQWYGKKQWLNILTKRIRHNKWYTHMMVAGLRQFEYAKKLGFKNDQILWPLCSANTSLFETVEINEERFKSKDFLFVGRYNHVKGVKYLLKAWNKIDHNNGEKLHLVGNGDSLPENLLSDSVVVHPFLSQEELLTIAKNCRAFVLPSTYEPWGIVIHEFAAAGMPLIVSDACGASDHFLINNYNGVKVRSRSIEDLEKAIEKIKEMSPKELEVFGIRSRKLSYSISPELVANNILSVYNSN